MLYLPITKAWIISRVARRVYFACALASFLEFGLLIASSIARQLLGTNSLATSPLAFLIVRLLLWPGIAGAATLSIAMWYFWFGFDKSGWLTKAVWFVPLGFLIPIGPAFYYFFVYRRDVEVKKV